MKEFTENSKRLMRGAIDTHVHSNPYPGKANSSALQVVRQAKKAGMKAVVLKCSRFPTGGYAYLISQIVKDIKVYGMVVLNTFIGGLNLSAVQAAIILGQGIPGEYTKIVSMPTKSMDQFDYSSPATKAICELIGKYNLTLATGHLMYDDIVAVVDNAQEQGVKKIIITHPQQLATPLSVKQQTALSEKGCYMEVCYCQTTDYYREKYKNQPASLYTAMRLVDEIKAVGVQKCIFATDFGADPGVNPPPVEGLQMFIEDMLKFGITEDDIEIMKGNAARLLGI